MQNSDWLGVMFIYILYTSHRAHHAIQFHAIPCEAEPQHVSRTKANQHTEKQRRSMSECASEQADESHAMNTISRGKHQTNETARQM